MAVFTIKKWGGWAPGLDQPAHWAAWASGQKDIATVGEPKALAMPPMLRRRAGRHVRMAFEAAHACVQGEKNLPVVFCSRHGEVKRSLDILDPIARGEAVSPAAFSLSVHNAIAGLYSIALAETAPMTAISGTADSAALGVIEACGQLAEGAAAVLLVVYDIEYLGRARDYLAIADNYFTQDEARLIADAPEPQRAAMFYHLWAQREASYKAACTQQLSSALWNGYCVAVSLPDGMLPETHLARLNDAQMGLTPLALPWETTRHPTPLTT